MLDTNKNNLIILNGTTITDIPDDLFIPPDALRVILEQFEGYGLRILPNFQFRLPLLNVSNNKYASRA